VLAEVIPQVARFLEDTPAVAKRALEVELDSLSVGVANFDGLVPGVGNSFKGLRDLLAFELRVIFGRERTVGLFAHDLVG